jgi:hypothetical protein
VELQKRMGVELKVNIYGISGGDLWTPFLSTYKKQYFHKIRKRTFALTN